MRFLVFLSAFMVPLILFVIVGYGLLMKKNIYEIFVKGAGDGIRVVVKIMPTLIGLMAAVGILRASGFLDMIAGALGKCMTALGFPAELVPLTIVRLFSSSAATGLALDIFKEYGPDSRIGLIASVLMSCTETVFYTMSVYFMAARVKKSRYTLAGAMTATLAGMIASVLFYK